jgi:hypothetical protein
MSKNMSTSFSPFTFLSRVVLLIPPCAESCVTCKSINHFDPFGDAPSLPHNLASHTREILCFSFAPTIYSSFEQPLQCGYLSCNEFGLL